MRPLRIGVLVFQSTSKKLGVGTKRIIKIARDRGHEVKVFFAPHVGLIFGNGKTLVYKGKAISKDDFDVILVRPGFNIDPSVNSSIIKQFQLAGFFVLNGYIGVFRAKNKIRTMQMLDHFRIPVPKTLVVQDAKMLQEAALEFRFPVILKTIYGTHGNGVFIAESKRSLAPVVDYLIAREKGPISLQEYVKEAKGADIRVFVCGTKVVAAMQRVAKSGEFRANFHKGGSVGVADLTDEEKEIGIKASKILGLDISGVDILRTKTGPKVIEVNSNPGVEGISKASGIDVAEKVVMFVESQVRKVGKKGKKPIPKRKMTE